MISAALDPIRAAVEFRLLGPLEIVHAGELLPLGGAQQRAIIALLLLHAPDRVDRDRLIEELWEERQPATAAHAVEVHISALRKLLRVTGDGVEVRNAASRYWLEVEPELVDVRRFERLLCEGQNLVARDLGRARERLDEALELWRGAPLSDLGRFAFARREAARLGELRAQAIECVAEARLAAGEHGAVIATLTELVAAEPLRENPRRLLMVALYRAGRHSEALTVYRDAAAALDQVGLQPGPGLRQLEADILRHAPALAPPEPVADTVSAPRPPPPPERRRTITALSCRVTTAEPDPEAHHDVMSRCVAEIRAAVERHGGRLDLLAGDAAIAVFGAPRMQEDDALRAVRAAVEMRARLRAPPGFSAALSTGLAIVRDADDLAVSAPINAAMRLAGVAEPGDILLADETLQLVRDAVRVEPLPGIGSAFRLLQFDPTAPGLARDFERPLLGRERELELLRGAWERALEEPGCHLYTVLGPAGVGKSRLIHELLRSLGDSATVLSGRCLHYGEGITFWPLLEALASLGEIADGVRDLLAAGGFATPEELFWEVRRLLESAADARPLILHVDDLQWAQPMLLDLLDHVVEFSRGAPILVLCAARPELFEDRPAWGGGKLNATSALLKPLPAEACERLLDQLSDGRLGADTRARLITASDGNPLFLEELATLAEADGTVVVPPTIHAVLAARLERLAVDERTVLELGAVEGEVFHRRAVAALAHLAADADPDRCLADLVRKDLVRPHVAAMPGDDAYRFRHILIRDAAYDSLPRAVRARMHEHLAGWLEETGGALAELDEIAGWHLEQTIRYRRALGAEIDDGLARRAAAHLHAAGRRARDRSDPAAAVNLLDRAHALAPADTLRLGIGVDLAEQLINRGDLRDVDALLLSAEHDSATAAQAMLTRFEWSIRAQPEDMMGTIHDAIPRLLRRLALAGDERGVARAHLLAYWVHMQEAHAASGSEQALLAAEHARSAGDNGLRSRALGLYLGPLISLDIDAETMARRLEPIEAEDSGQYVAAFVAMVRSEIERLRGSRDAARRLMQSAIDQFNAMGDPIYAAATQFYLALGELSFGAPARALPTLLESDASLAALGERSFRSTTQATLADVYELLGDKQKARAAIELSDALGGEDDLLNIVLTHAVRARLALAEDDAPAAERWARSAVEHAFRTDYAYLRGNAQIDLARVLAALGRRDEATALARAALELFAVKGDRPRTQSARAVLDELELGLPLP